MSELEVLNHIERQLQKFAVTDTAISDLQQQYLPLRINGTADKEGYKIVNGARKVVKGLRVSVEKKRKELLADALVYQKAINAEARRIGVLIEPIELHLIAEEDGYDLAVQEEKNAKEKAQQEFIQGRVNELMQLGFVFNGEDWRADYNSTGVTLFTNPHQIKTLSVDDWNKCIIKFKESYRAAKDEKDFLDKAEAEYKAAAELEAQKQIEALKAEVKRLADLDAARMQDVFVADADEKEATIISKDKVFTAKEVNGKPVSPRAKQEEKVSISEVTVEEINSIMTVEEKYKKLLEFAQRVAGEVIVDGNVVCFMARHVLEDIGEQL